MKTLIIILSITIITLLVILLKSRKQILTYSTILKEKDIALTNYIAKNLDLEKELEETNHDFSIQKSLSEEIKKIQEQSRMLKHDMKNHTLVILSYLEENKSEEAKKYTSDILDKLNLMYTYVNIGNSLMNYIINNKLSNAKAKQIEIKAEIENLAFDYLDSVDFSSLLNNLLDNAIEAAEKSERRVIEINILNKKGFDTINIKNSINQSVLEHNPDLISTKSESGHGFGSKQIRKITEKYDGMLDIYEENGMFCINIAFNN